MRPNYYPTLLAILALLLGCQQPNKQPPAAPATTPLDLSMDNLFAWCVVPFDSVERSPQARVAMLRELGFSAYAYDWREQHLAEMAEEWQLAEASGLDVMAVWLWINGNTDQPGQLSASNEQVLQAIASTQLQTQLWVGFNANYFEQGSAAQRIEQGAEMVGYLQERAAAMGCRVALYNHGDWFGEPANQVKIIEALQTEEVGIIYNFHHAHPQLDRFQSIVDTMLPYLWAVNLNGMKADGPKILPIAAGDREAAMLQILRDQGYRGPFGILGHVDDADVRVILEENLAGLRGLADAIPD